MAPYARSKPVTVRKRPFWPLERRIIGKLQQFFRDRTVRNCFVVVSEDLCPLIVPARSEMLTQIGLSTGCRSGSIQSEVIRYPMNEPLSIRPKVFKARNK